MSAWHTEHRKCLASLEVTSLRVKNLTHWQNPHQIDPHFQHPDSIKKPQLFGIIGNYPFTPFWHGSCYNNSIGQFLHFDLMIPHSVDAHVHIATVGPVDNSRAGAWARWRYNHDMKLSKFWQETPIILAKAAWGNGNELMAKGLQRLLYL